MTTKQHKGFTIAEIQVVVIIIVILGLAVLIGINPIAQIFKGFDARRKADLNKIKIALEAYYADHECYPNFPLVDSQNRPSYACDSDILKPYLTSMPCDPSTKQPYTLFLTPAGSTCPQNYAIYAQIYSFFDNQANSIDYCPDTVAMYSAGMRNVDIIEGCSSRQICFTWYGCQNGACVPVAQDQLPSCSPAYCDSDCSPVTQPDGSVVDCSTINPETGEYTRACVEF